MEGLSSYLELPGSSRVSRRIGRLRQFSTLPSRSKMAKAAAGGKAKKKWSKGKVKDKAQHAVIVDKALMERLNKEVPTFKFISQSVLIDRMKINGSLARKAIRHFEQAGQIKPIVHHNGQLIYTRATAAEAA